VTAPMRGVSLRIVAVVAGGGCEPFRGRARACTVMTLPFSVVAKRAEDLTVAGTAVRERVETQWNSQACPIPLSRAELPLPVLRGA